MTYYKPALEFTIEDFKRLCALQTDCVKANYIGRLIYSQAYEAREWEFLYHDQANVLMMRWANQRDCELINNG